jgi:hypothetical protein
MHEIHSFFRDFFEKFFFGHLFLSIFLKSEKVSEKCKHPYHNWFLWSGHKKNNFHFVTIKLKLFFAKRI